MKKSEFFDNLKTVYFIGIGGIFMCALAKYCLASGKRVYGSDVFKGETVAELISLGAEICIGHNGDIPESTDAVVYTSAVNSLNKDLICAEKRGIPIFKRSEFLALILDGFIKTVAVSGCHGKTTTTAMIARALISAGELPTVFIGGEDKVCGNFVYGEKKIAVSEACEYKKNFLDMRPSVAVITNIGYDHADTYKDIDEVISAFSEFASHSLAVVNADDINCKSIIKEGTITFGFSDGATVCGKNLRKSLSGYSFTLYIGGKKKFRVNLKTLGRFNAYNAIAAFAACYALKIPPESVKGAIENFQAVKRRTEYLGEYCGKCVYADYAHHPDEIKEVLTVFPKNCLIVFQPHTYSRTYRFKEEFVKVLKKSDTVIFKTYPAREKYFAAGDGYSLYLRLEKISKKKIFYAKNISFLKKYIKEVNATSVAFIGAGDVYATAKKIIDKKT